MLNSAAENEKIEPNKTSGLHLVEQGIEIIVNLNTNIQLENYYDHSIFSTF